MELRLPYPGADNQGVVGLLDALCNHVSYVLGGVLGAA
jgi:hypothetical protein